MTTARMTAVEALSAALFTDYDCCIAHDDIVHDRDHIAEALRANLTVSGWTLVRSDELLDIARIAGADLSDITDPAQIMQPSLIEYVTEEVSVLRDAYRECLAERA